jgi:threonine/homoserine/homoserine lactone efflux protein
LGALSEAGPDGAVGNLIDSPAATLIVNLVIVALLGWLGITFFRVILRDSEDEARKTRVHDDRP